MSIDYEDDAVYKAIIRNKFGRIKKMVRKGADMEAACWWDQNDVPILPLLVACSLGRTKIVQYLVESCRVNIEATEEDTGMTMLHIVASFSLDLTRYFVKLGINVEATDKVGRTALHVASESNKPEIVRCLIEMGNANVEAMDHGGDTALIAACLQSHLEPIKVLVEVGGADVDADLDSTGSVVWIASTHDYMDIVRYLVEECHANLDSQNGQGLTLLQEAILAGSLDRFHYFVNRCSVDIMGKCGRTALILAIEQSAGLEMVQCLIQCRANTEVKNAQGHTALHMASAFNHSEIVRCLVEMGKADVEARSNLDMTALHVACSMGHLETTQVLVGSGADVHARVGVGRSTALQLANRKKNVQLVRYLVEDCHSPIDTEDKYGNMAVHIACRYKIVEHVLYFMNRRPNADNHDDLVKL